MDIDKSNYLGVLEEFPEQCRNACKFAQGVKLSNDADKIIVAGMGGSSIGGDLLKIFMKDSQIPVFTVRDYTLPKFVNNKTLVIVVSYSGNTEETLSCYEEAISKGAQILAITSGGILAQKAKNVIRIPGGMQPRSAIAYLFFPMLMALNNSGILSISQNDIDEMASILNDKKTFHSTGKKIASKLKGKIPLIYSSSLFAPVAYRWKTQINENSKWPAFTHSFPELNHNELVSYKLMKKKDFATIYIKDKDDHERVKKRMDITSKLTSKNTNLIEVTSIGNSLLARVFYTIYIGDFVSYYLALLNKQDPTPVDVIENLKKKLSE